MDLSIVIVSWNTRELLAACLESIERFPPSGKFETWVVDNASSDGTPEMIENDFPAVKLIAETRNLGFAGANNLAIRKAGGEFILLLNPDTVVRPGSLTTLLKYMKENDDVGAAGAKLTNPDGSLQVSCYPFPTLRRELWRLLQLDRIYAYGVYDMPAWSTTSARAVDVIQGACLLVRREALEQVGLLDEDYFIYTEEVDLCYRIRKANWTLSWVPSADVVHYGGQSTRQVAAEMFLRLYESKVIFFRKHRGRLSGFGYKLVLLLISLLRVVGLPLAGFLRPENRGVNREISANYRQLIRSLPSL